VKYTLPGSLPAGTYHIEVSGLWQDAVLHAELIYSPQLGSASTIAAVDSTGLPPGSGFPQGAISTDVQGPPIAAQCGDLLILRVKYVSGPTSYIQPEGTKLNIP
jgi:hypothetical protein